MTTVAETVDRDTSSIQSDDWPVRHLGVLLGQREDRFQVVYSQSVLDEMHLHGQGANGLEICGVLVGTGYQDSQGPYLLVEHCIRGNGARTKATNVTFTAETWANIQNEMDAKYTDKRMIGWYHTHPGFGIFLSDMDVFICDNFFNLPWQIAFVYDPIGGDEGNFVWRAGKPEREVFLIEDDVTPQSAEIPLISTADAMAETTESDPKLIELLIRVRRLESRQKAMATAMAFFAAFVIICLIKLVQLATPVKPATQPALTTEPPTVSAGNG